jgi:hypothetical protein
MRYRAPFIAGLAVGFVIGTRAGRERYEQMKKLARRAADSPAVQQAAGAAAAQATGLAKTATSKVVDKVHQRTPAFADSAVRKATDKLPGRRDRQAADRQLANGDDPGQ